MDRCGETTAGREESPLFFSTSSEPNPDRLKSVASAAIDASASKLNDLSQGIWKNPELHFKEFKAHTMLTNFLEDVGFKVERSYKLETAFRATYQNVEDATYPNVAVLCEYDALPVIGHACGHNLIAEVGVGAGIGVKAAMMDCGLNLGQFTVLGCPAEESGGGKIALIQAGAFENVNAALMSHPSNFSAIDAFFVATQAVRVTYHGISSHAAVEPWKGINALDAAVMAYTSISNLRQQMKPNYRVHGIFTKGGAAPNIIPDEAELLYYIRAPTDHELDELIVKVKACFEGAAIATGCKAEYHWEANRYKDMITNRSLAETYRRNALRFGVELSKVTTDNMGSTDMGNVSYVAPSIHPHFFFGDMHPEHSVQFAQHSGSEAAQAPAIREAKILAFTAIDILCNPQLLASVQGDYEQDMKSRTNQLHQRSHDRVG